MGNYRNLSNGKTKSKAERSWRRHFKQNVKAHGRPRYTGQKIFVPGKAAKEFSIQKPNNYPDFTYIEVRRGE